MKKTQNGKRQRAFSGTALPDEPKNLAGLDFEPDVAQDTGLVAIIHRKPKGQKWRSLAHLCAPRAGSGPRRRTSAFQKACGSKTEGDEPMTAGETADMASLFTR